MRILFVGSKNLGVRCLRALVGFRDQGLLEIAGVIARADDDEDHWYGSVAELARSSELRLFMPDTLRDEALLAELRDVRPTVGICCFFPKLFREEFFGLPPHGFLNLHFAPLPKYRGAFPVPYALMADERMHGVTLHQIDAGMDTGPVVKQRLLPVYRADTGFDLYHRCEDVALNLFQDAVAAMLSSGLPLPARSQDDERAITHVSDDLSSFEVEPSWGAKRVYNFVRALDFPPYDLPYVVVGDDRRALARRPDRHEASFGREPFVEWNGRPVYIEE